MIPSVDLLEPRRRWLTRWIGAATLISAIHIGGGSLAMLYGLEEFVEELRGAIVVEIAPVATTLAMEVDDVPPGELAEAREETKAAFAPKIVKVEEDAPRQDLPSPVEPEVVLPKPTPVEERPKEEPKEEASQQVRVSETPTKASPATAPLRVDAQTSNKSAAPEIGTAASNARAIVTWKNSVVLHLKRNKRAYAAERNVEGTVTVRFSMDRSGQLLTSQVLHGSGFKLLDDEALQLLKRASPLPRPPVSLAGETLEFNIPIRFHQ
jgi:protein TonB